MKQFDQLFGPLKKEYCEYFLFFSILGFVLMVFSLFGLVYVVATKRTKIDMSLMISMLSLTTGYYLTYLSNRLFLTMCQKVL